MPRLRNSAKKSARLNLRLDGRLLRRAERAARLSHRTLSEFATMALVAQTEAELSLRERWLLDEADWNTFLNALERPFRANKQLKAALTEHAARVAP